MDNPCNGCAANRICPYFRMVDSYSEQCEEILARLVEGSRDSYRMAWDSYIKEDENIDFNRILSGLL